MLTQFYRHRFRACKRHPVISYCPVRSAFDVEVHGLQGPPDRGDGVQRGKVFCRVIFSVFQGGECLLLGTENPVCPFRKARGEGAQVRGFGPWFLSFCPCLAGLLVRVLG